MNLGGFVPRAACGNHLVQIGVEQTRTRHVSKNVFAREPGHEFPAVHESVRLAVTLPVAIHRGWVGRRYRGSDSFNLQGIRIRKWDGRIDLASRFSVVWPAHEDLFEAFTFGLSIVAAFRNH